MDEKSIMQYIPESSTNKCGYCKKRSGSKQIGLWAYQLTVNDYQNLIDRGWRRCGQYCYKPNLSESCCVLYTIRCEATEFKLRRSQKKILNQFNGYLASGDIRRKHYTDAYGRGDLNVQLENENRNSSQPELTPTMMVKNELISVAQTVDSKVIGQGHVNPKPGLETSLSDSQTHAKKLNKAKQIRINRKRAKLMSRGLSDEELNKKMLEKKKFPVVKSVEDFIDRTITSDDKNQLEVRLVQSHPPSEEFQATLSRSYELYCKYQISVHKDDPSSLTQDSFERFLVRSPLLKDGQFGSFHQQYWLNDKLVAVGVVDILPLCVSSVYLYYDPDFNYLSLGTYSSIREVHLVRSLNKNNPMLKFYYMGFYIRTCPKMRYKGSLSPSYLLCPEVYSWHPIEDCIPLMERTRYSRLNGDKEAIDENEGLISDIGSVLFKGKSQRLENVPPPVRALSDVSAYVKHVGAKCANSSILYLE